MSGEASAALTHLPERAHAGIERNMDALCRTYPVSALCQYDRATTPRDQLAQASAQHAWGVRESQLHTAETEGGLTLAGEVDWSNELVLMSVVQAASSMAVAVFWLDLRQLAFLSIGGCRALMIGTQRFRDRGGHLVLLAAPGIIERVLRLCELDTLPNVEIVESMP
jgi:anti-anti-sigma factor